MKKILIFLFVLPSLFYLGAKSVSAEALWNCTRFELRVKQTGGPWTGGQWNVTCPGDTGASGCVGENKNFSGIDGELVTLNHCSCFNQPGNQACLNIPNIASTVSGCTASLPNGTSGPNGYCGTNGDYKYPTIEINCPTPSPSPSPTPSRTPTPSPTPSPTTPVGQPPTNPPPPNSTPTNTPPPNAPTKTPSPTTPPACNAPCPDSNYCKNAQDGCTVCTPSNGGKTCQPPTSPSPSNTPVPTNTPKPTNTPVPTNTPPPPPTPTPDFNDAMCKCDSLNVEQITLGNPIKVESFSKVEGADTTKAEIQKTIFSIYEGNPAAGRVKKIEESEEPVTIVDNTPQLVRYRSEWTVSPQIKMGEEYRIAAVPKCAAKIAQAVSDQQRVVLASRDENVGFFGQIINFFAGLFGGGSAPDKNTGVQIANEDKGPLAAIANFFKPQGAKREQLQLDTFTPAQMDKEACNIMKFKFDFVSP